MDSIAIVGAGRTGRGFIARLLQGQVRLVFFDRDEALVRTLRERGRYMVGFFDGRPPVTISGYEVFHTDDPAAAEKLAACRAVFVAVGGENAARAGAWLRERANPGACVIACENAARPAALIAPTLGRTAGSGAVFCTTVEGEGVDILGESYPTLYVGGVSPWVAGLKGIEAVPDFDILMTRKILTYNAASAVIAYLGAERGHRLLADAANDPAIEPLLDQFYAEINAALCREYGIDPAVQREFALLSKQKFQNRAIEDSIERNAASPRRKLGPDERIIGPARLILKWGGDPEVLCRTAAAALRALGVGAEGVEEALTTVCGLDPREPLYRMILAAWRA